MINPTTGEVTVRIYEQTAEGEWIDWQEDYGLEDFAGSLPAAGDMILAPGVLRGLNRYDPVNRKLLTVVQRVFNPRDLPNYVVLVVEQSPPIGRERVIVSPR